MTNFTRSKLLYIVFKNSAEISESIQFKMKGLNTEPKMKWKEAINY